MENRLLLFSSFDQLTLVRLKQAAALFNSFSATCSTDWVVSFNDSSELHITFNYHSYKNKTKIAESTLYYGAFVQLLQDDVLNLK